jgi:vacuolar protein-sorting-associated protein 4
LKEELYIEEKFLVTEKFSVDWSDIPDSFVKRDLEEMILKPLKHCNIFSSLENPWRNILVYGFAGTGKTYLLRSLTSKIDCTLLWVTSCDLCSRYIGETEKYFKKIPYQKLGL